MVFYSKACQKCDAADNRGEEVEEHDSTKNVQVRSKSMEAATILKMVEDALHDICFIIDVVVSENDSTMRAVIKHPPIGA